VPRAFKVPSANTPLIRALIISAWTELVVWTVLIRIRAAALLAGRVIDAKKVWAHVLAIRVCMARAKIYWIRTFAPA
jgi:hypothetical protein